MSTDTRPSVTVIGQLEQCALGGWLIVLDDFLGIGLQDGDEVDVTIRKHERATSIWPAPDEADE